MSLMTRVYHILLASHRKMEDSAFSMNIQFTYNVKVPKKRSPFSKHRRDFSHNLRLLQDHFFNRPTTKPKLNHFHHSQILTKSMKSA